MGLFLSVALMFCTAATAAPQRVLVIQALNSCATPQTIGCTTFESTLSKVMGSGVDIDEVCMDAARDADPDSDDAFANFLTKNLVRWRPDLVVTVGSPPARFVAKYRDQLFPQTPVLYSTADQRVLMSLNAFQTNTTYVGTAVDIAGFGKEILQLAPDTTNVVVAIGASPLERYWTTAFRNGWASFTNRFQITFLNDLSFDEMQERLAHLPPHSFIFLPVLIRDIHGVTLNEDQALQRFRTVANAPINGIWQYQLGMGIVGGRLYPVETVGEESARVAARILRGEPASSIPPTLVAASLPQYDWEQLRRWQIPESRLPAGSTVKFRQPTFWEQYAGRILAACVFLLAQTALIAGLLVNWAKRKETQQALSESEERLTMALDAAGAGAWRFNISANQVWTSDSGRELMGLPANGPLQLESFWDAIHPEDKEAVHTAVETALRTATPLSLEFRLIKPGGNVRWISARGRCHANGHGKSDTYLGISVDMTERKRAEIALKENEERLRLILEANSEGVWDWNINTGDIFFSHDYTAMLGYRPDEFVRNFDEWKALVHPDDSERVRIAREAHLKHRKEFCVDFRMRKKSGAWCWVRSRGTAVEWDERGQPIRMVGTHLDITEQQDTELERERLSRELVHANRVSTMAALTGSLAHELNQPLSAILSNAQAGMRFLNSNSAEVSEVRGALEDIAQDTRRAGQVIRQMRALVKKDEPKLQPLDLNALISDVVRLLHSDLVIRRFRIAPELGENLREVSADNVQMQQVMLNLILNAFDAMRDNPDDKRMILIRTRRQDLTLVRIEVRDTGTGISPEKLLKLFEPFHSTKRDGLGLGLAISQSIIEGHRGRLWAENNPDRGATFYFTLPIHNPELNGK